MSTTFMKVQDVADELGVSKSYAYKIVQKLNDELKAQGFITISGRINKQYFLERSLLRRKTEREKLNNVSLQRRKNKHLESLLPLYRLAR